MNKRLLLVLGAFLILLGGLAAGCANTDDLEERVEALEAQAGEGSGIDPSEAQMQLEEANMVATLNLLDGVGFHDLNETIVADEVAPAGTAGTIRKATTAVATTAWPADLEEGAAELQTNLEAFLALLEEDVQGTEIADASTVAHDSWHDFSDTAWSYLGERAGLEPAADDHEEGEEPVEGTPGATEEAHDEEADQEEG